MNQCVLTLCLSFLSRALGRGQEGKNAEDDKLSLACFNSGDVPELIGRLSVALSRSHKIISLPMFRKDRMVSYGGYMISLSSVLFSLPFPPLGSGLLSYQRRRTYLIWFTGISNFSRDGRIINMPTSWLLFS